MSETSPKPPYSWMSCSAEGVQRNECSFTWTLENFSFLPQKVGEKVRSDQFFCSESCDCNWYLELYPMGVSLKDQNFTWLSLTFNSQNYCTTYAYCKFFARNTNNQQFWEMQDNDKFEKEKGWYYKIMKFDEIKEKLTNDVLKIHVELTVFIPKEQMLLKKGDKIMHFSSTGTIFEKHTFRWNAANFLNFRKVELKSVSSSLFFPNKNSKWQWRLRLKTELGTDEMVDEQFILGLIPEKKPDNVRCPLQYNILVTNSRNELFKTLSNKLVFTQAEEWHTIGETKKLLNHFRDGFLQLQVTILVPSHTENFRKFTVVSHEQNCSITDEFASMFQRGEHSDMTISVEGKNIPVHKAILATRSPVFRSMLQHDTLEKQEGKIEIKDLNFETMMHALRFMYTNKLTADDDTSVMEVLKAAEKYQVDKLKNMCEEHLILNLNTGNVSEIISCAETYQATTLRDEALNFKTLYSDDLISSFNNMEMKTT